MKIWRNARAAFAIAVAAALAVVACGGSSTASNASQGSKTCAAKVPASALDSPGVLHIATNATLPPLSYQGSSGNLQGERVDLGNDIAQELCLKVSWTNIIATAMLPGLQAKRWDVVDIGYFITPARTQQMEMIATEKMGVGVSVARGNPLHIKSTASLAGKSVATSVGSFEETTIKDINQKQVAEGMKPMDIHSFDNYDLVFQALTSGQVDAAVSTDPVNQYYAARGGFAKPISGLNPTPTSLTVAGGNDELAKDIVLALKGMKKDGSYQKLMRKYSLTPVPSFQAQWTGTPR